MMNGMFKSRHMRHIFLFFLLVSKMAAAQVITLDQVNQLAQTNYPLISQNKLISQTADINIDNLSKNFLPQVTLSGQASYQSEVTKITIPVPGIYITPPNKDQYKLIADVNQLIYDGGAVKEQKKIQLLNSDLEQKKVAVELFKLKERINQLYLSVLFFDEQLKQVELVKADLRNGINKVEAQVKNGVAFRSNLNVLKAELLKADQRIIELRSARKGLIETLELFINQKLNENTSFQKPENIFAGTDTLIQRPELNMFTAQEKLINSQYKLIDARNLPKASLFAQGGYGRPGLNFLKNEFEFYYLTGVRINWSLGNLYTKKNDHQLLEVNKKIVNVQKDIFLLNTNTQLKQQSSEIEKLQQLIVKDNEIIVLRTGIKEAAKAQLENGVITANDYLREVNAEDQSRQTLITHQLQLLQAQINYQTISGK